MKLLLYLLAGFIFFVIYIRFLERVSLFYPSREIVVTPKEAGLTFEDIFFSTKDHIRLNGWLVKRQDHSLTAGTILFCHGNAGTIGDRVEKIKILHDLGLNVFIFDYRGYGHSQGRPTEQGMYADTQAAYDYLQSRGDLAKSKIILYGASMGGVAAIDLATRESVAALIADSTFTSAADMAKTIVPYVPAILLTVKLDNASKIKKVKVPKLFIHSPDDETVPFRLGRKLFALAPEPKSFLEIRGNHNEGYALSESVFLPGIENFLDQYNLR